MSRLNRVRANIMKMLGGSRGRRWAAVPREEMARFTPEGRRPFRRDGWNTVSPEELAGAIPSGRGGLRAAAGRMGELGASAVATSKKASLRTGQYAAGGAVGLFAGGSAYRYVTDTGTPFRNKRGEFDIAGIPFI